MLWNLDLSDLVGVTWLTGKKVTTLTAMTYYDIGKGFIIGVKLGLVKWHELYWVLGTIKGWSGQIVQACVEFNKVVSIIISMLGTHDVDDFSYKDARVRH